MAVKNYIFAGTDPAPTETEKRNRQTAREIADEGIVLLKNEGVLPIRRQKIALFGFGARMTVKGGTGSGSVNERHSVTIEEGLAEAGYLITTKDWLDRCERNYHEVYDAWHAAREKDIEGIGISDVSGIMQILAVVGKTPFVYPTGIPISDEDIAAADTDVAIYVVSRQAGEGDDRSLREGDFLFDETERENLARIAEHFKDTVLVVNAGGQVDISFAEKIGIKAIVFYGQPGQEGGTAFADIVSGKISPSGKLTATWVKKYEDIPFGDRYGAQGDPREQNYAEDIYVGYRYYDTFGVAPAYPFGFGLSYTQFDIDEVSVSQRGDEIEVCGRVRNAGVREGKETVQVYVSVPHGNDGAEYQRLVGFYKTPLLPADKCCEFAVRFALDELSRYNEERAAYLLESGEYVLRVGNSSRNTAPVCKFTVKETFVLEKCINICPQQKTFNVLRAPERKEALPVRLQELNLKTRCLKTKVHTYEDLSPCVSKETKRLIGKMSAKEMAVLVTGGGYMGDKIVSVFGSSGTTTCDLYEKYGIPNIVMTDGPAGLNVAKEFSVGADGKIMALAVPPAYDFGIFGQYIRDTIARETVGGTAHYQFATAWPSGTNVAQTWNPELAEVFGCGVAAEMQAFGASVWLAPGMNIQKNPLCGRNFEYYSEDPLLSGTIAAAVIAGVQKDGRKAVSVKHFCCNNMELDRSYSSSNLSERALREIYLKGFRRALGAKPLTVMSSYNKINGVYSPNNADLLIKVLRCEWNFEGAVMTDWTSCGEDKADAVRAIACENDLIMPGAAAEAEAIAAAAESGTLPLKTLQKCAMRVLELIKKTAAIPFGPQE